MNLNHYQSRALETAKPTARTTMYLIPGLAAEAGEVADKYAKYVRDGGDPQVYINGVAKELGDVLWFVAVTANAFGFTLEQIARENLSKLASRQARGKLGGSGDDR